MEPLESRYSDRPSRGVSSADEADVADVTDRLDTSRAGLTKRKTKRVKPQSFAQEDQEEEPLAQQE